jgi:hypothetical protein
VRATSIPAVIRSALQVVVFATLFLALFPVHSPVLPEEWYVIFGGPGEDWVSSLAQTSDGGYVFTGMTRARLSSYWKCHTYDTIGSRC